MFNLGFKRIRVLVFGFLIILNIQCNKSYPNTEITTCIKLIRSHQFTEINKLLLNKKKGLKILVSNYSKLIQNNGYRDDLNRSINFLKEEHSKDELALYHLNKGLYLLLYEYDEETDAFRYLKKALDSALDIEHKELICEISKSILLYYDKLVNIKDNYPRYYLEVYENNLYDQEEEFIYEILKLNAKIFTNHNSEIKTNEILSLKNKLEKSNLNYYKALANKTLGQYYDFIKKEKRLAIQFHLKGKNDINNLKYGAANILRQAFSINIASLYFELDEYKKSIEILNTIKNDTTTKTMSLYTAYKDVWLYEAYNKLSIIDSAFYYHNKKEELEDKLGQEKHARVIAKENIINETEKKQNRINMLSRSVNVLLPILLISILIGVVVYFLYKKYRKKSVGLEKQQSETLQKIDELKQIVIKNHIVLTDHTKIYVADLLYIKSDDHYLNLFLSNGKNHFVRGKLKTIINQLPPNFVRCHRSHIVNRNFVKKINPNFFILIDQTEIPISRSFKNDL